MYYSYDEKAVHIFEDSFFIIVIILFVFFRFKSTKKFRIFVIKKFPIYKMIHLDIIEKTFKGPIQQQLREALQYIRNVVITEKVVKHADRAEADRFVL